MSVGNGGRSSAVLQDLVSITEMARRLGVAKNTLYDWCAVRKIPHIKLGKFLRFDLAEIDAWLQAKRVMLKDA